MSTDGGIHIRLLFPVDLFIVKNQVKSGAAGRLIKAAVDTTTSREQSGKL